MGEQGIILSCLLRLKTSCRFEFPHLCLQCTTHYSFISFLTATAEKKPSWISPSWKMWQSWWVVTGKDSVPLPTRRFSDQLNSCKVFQRDWILTTDHRDNLIISTIESVLTAELGEIMSIVVWQWLAENVA